MNIQGDKYGFWKISNFRPVSAILKSNLDQNSKKGQNLAFKQRKRAYMWKFSKPIVPGPLDIHKVLLQAKNLTFSGIWDEENRTKLRSFGSEKGQFSIQNAKKVRVGVNFDASDLRNGKSFLSAVKNSLKLVRWILIYVNSKKF